MIKTALGAFAKSTRQLLTSWRTVAIFFAAYAALLAALYAFFSTQQALAWQLLLSLLLAVVALALFFLIQAMAVSYTQSDMQPGRLLGRSLKYFWKLVLVSLPVVLLAALVIYLFSKVQVGEVSAKGAPRSLPSSGGWRAVAFAALQLLLFYIAFPLVVIHLWIATMRAGLGATFARLGRILARAFAPQALFIYTIGVLVFGGIAYLLILVRTPAKGVWVEIGLLGARLVLAFVLGLFGWVITLGALAVIAAEGDDQPQV
jgi:hypothetical protein